MKMISQVFDRFVGLDVHAATIAVAVAEVGGEIRFLGTVPNLDQAIVKLVKRLNGDGLWTACYEAGPTGYALYWLLSKLGIPCSVIAPTLVPMKSGDRIKTDRRDALRLAQSFRAGELTPVWVPDHAHEALRDLVRVREAAKQDQLRARHRLSKFLLRYGHRPDEKMTPWTQKYLEWIKSSVRFEFQAQQWTLEDLLGEIEHAALRISRLDTLIDQAVESAPQSMKEVVAALQALRGIGKVSAVTIVAEVGQLSRFPTARQFMGYSGTIPSEHSSGTKTRRGGITKTGNAHLRRIVVEAAWSQRHRPIISRIKKAILSQLSVEVQLISTKAMHRLYARYTKLIDREKNKQQVVTAVARELLGFIWAIGVAVERTSAA